MRPASYGKIAWSLLAIAILLPANGSSHAHGAARSVSVSVVTDAALGPAARHGLNKLVSALKAKNVAAEQRNGLEAARGEVLIVAGQAACSSAVAALHKGITPPEGAEALLIHETRWKGKTTWLVSGADDRGLMYALLD